MNTNLTIPDDLNILPDVSEKRVMKVDTQTTDQDAPFKVAREAWNTGDISAYRAAYMKAHRLEP